MMTVFKEDLFLCFSENELLRRLQLPNSSSLTPELEEMIQKAKKRIEEIMQPMYVQSSFPIKVENESVQFPFGTFQSHSLVRCLGNYESVTLFAATLGHSIDRELRSVALFSSLYQWVFDAVASTYIEALCDYVENASSNLHSSRVSPGYGDISLQMQQPILSYLRAQIEVGITLSPSSLMIPTKSVTALFGIHPKKESI